MNKVTPSSLDEDLTEETSNNKGGRPGKFPKPTSGQLEIYDIEFESSGGVADAARYKTLSAKLFQNINVRSLRLSGLNIERIDDDTFGSKAFGSYLQTLDLSRNAIRRIDATTLSNLKALQVIELKISTFLDHLLQKTMNPLTMN